jgi:hypothetical protein
VGFTWLDGAGLPAQIDVATDSGTFYLLGICPAGGTRLYNPDGQVSMAHVNPNPASGIIDWKNAALLNEFAWGTSCNDLRWGVEAGSAYF